MSERRNKMKSPRRSSQVSDSSTSSDSTSSFSSDDEETDGQDLKPIKDYLNDRRELASQLFKSVKLEKIRMMLPQVLKKINLYDIEEWCGNELSGMSKKRILSIINGQRLTESSDTDETDDSGPSLEIISDTEEWLTDEEVVVKEENSSVKSKAKKSTVKMKAKLYSKDKTKTKLKSTSNPKKDNKLTTAKVKVEGEKTEPKEGESLLDLLELEMRARAIRALIRKEEDIIPNNTTASTSSEKNTNPSASKYVVQEMEQISVTLKQGSGLDDDVMLVIQPAPTIELLSSESENEKEKSKEEESKRVNKRLENEREEEKKDDKNVSKRLESKLENEKKEQTRRVNKRLENERGIETIHNTSSIGDKAVENADNADNADNDLLKTVEHSSVYRKRNETVTVVDEIDKKFKEKVKDQETNKASDELPNTILDKSTDEISDRIFNKPTENLIVHKSADEKEVKKDKICNNDLEFALKPEKATDELKSIAQKVEKVSQVFDKSPDKEKLPEKELEEGELMSDSESKEETETMDSIKKDSFKKTIRRRHIRPKVHGSSDEGEDLDQSETVESESEVSDKGKNISKERRLQKRMKKIINNSDNSEVKRISFHEKVNESTKEKDEVEKMKTENDERKENKEKQNELIKEDADKTDMDEIIDLDDYPDDLENNEQNRKKSEPEPSTEKTEPAETWASRYYNTDDVQNVIKESKIQSEIRKRLRERQRMSKLNSPSTNTTGSNSPVDIKAEEAKQKPLGSVEEYLALKAATVETINSSVNEKTQVLPEKNKKFYRKSDSTRKNKSHSTKRRLQSEKDNVIAPNAKTKDATNQISVQSRPD